MQVSETELKTFILDSGLVARKEVDAADAQAREHQQSVGDVLVSNGALSSDALRRIKAYVLGMPFVNLKELKVPLEILSLIPEPVARTHNIIAYRKTGQELEVAMLDTGDLPAIDSVRVKTGLKIVPRLTDEESVKHALLQYQQSLKEEFGDLITSEAGKLSVVHGASAEDLKKIAEDLPTVRIVDTLLRHAVVQGASDIHIESLEQEMLVRYRIDGILHDAMTLPKAAGPGIIARIKILANLKLDEEHLPQDGRFKMETEGDKVSFRVSLLPTYFGEKIVMRLLRETGEGFTLEALGFHGSSLERMHAALKQSSGLILVSGPASSGKTTTLYTLLDILNTPNVDISTIEDPIEYQMKRINQTQVDPAIGFTFANGLRALLRQDSNIIMVGEIRDSETASLAVHAALTGHLVLSTIHADSAAGAISQLITMGIEPFLLASTLRAVVSQRLVRRLCDDKEEYVPNPAERGTIGTGEQFDAALKALMEEQLLAVGTKIDSVSFFHPKRGGECEEGYKGRIGLHEILTVSPTIRELIGQAAAPDAIEARARTEGMLTIIEDGLYKSARGITSLEEVAGATSK